jgi:hypothetical protein
MKNDFAKYVIGAAVGLVVGAAGATAMKPQSQLMGTSQSADTTVASSSDPDMEAHGVIRSAFQQHAAVAGDYLVKLVKGENTTAIRDGLDKNTQTLADTFAQAYGQDKRMDFVDMWESHIKEYENYATAAKNANTPAKNAAKNSLIQMSKDLELVMDQLNETPVDRIDELMQEHVMGTLSLIDAAVAKDEAKIVAFMDAGFRQAGAFGDYFFEIVSKEYPDKFK